MTLVQQNGYYATAYLSVNDALRVTPETKGYIDIAGKSYDASFVQLIPSIDEETQRAKVLFSIENSPSNLLLGAFTKIDISLAPTRNVVMVKKSALTLFKGDWIVFTEKEHEEKGHHEEKTDHEHEEEKASHDEHDHDAHKEKETDGHDDHDHDAHKAEKEHADNDHEEKEEGHEGHDEHEEESSPYEANVVKIIAYVGDEVAIEGLEEGEEYVSDGVYFVKSMILKSSLGEHGH